MLNRSSISTNSRRQLETLECEFSTVVEVPSPGVDFWRSASAPPADERRSVASAIPPRSPPATKKSGASPPKLGPVSPCCECPSTKGVTTGPAPHLGKVPVFTGGPSGVACITCRFPATTGTGACTCLTPATTGATKQVVSVRDGWTTIRSNGQRDESCRIQQSRKGSHGIYQVPVGIIQQKKDPIIEWVIKTSNRFECLYDAPCRLTMSNTGTEQGKSHVNKREFQNVIETSRYDGHDQMPLATLVNPVISESFDSTGELALTECNSVEFSDENAEEMSISEDVSVKNKQIPLSVGLWNINSINQQKFEYCIDFLNQEKNSILCLTELSSENRDTVNILAKNDDFPILNDPKNKRVGMMIPCFLKESVEVFDTWSWCQTRNRKSNKAVQMTLFRVNLNTIVITIVVVYAAPDTNIDGKRALCRKLCELGKNIPNMVVVGDFNIDMKDREKKRFLKTELSGMYTQIVNDFTRVKSRNFDGEIRISKTCIDLVLLSMNMKKKLIDTALIIKDAPSDHFLVKFSLDIKVPSKFVEKKYFLDPTRRKPIPKSKLDMANSELSELIKSHEALFERSNRVESINLLRKLMVQVLDTYAPMNKAGVHTKRIYRFTMPKDLRKLKKSLQEAKNKWRVAIRQKKKSSVTNRCRESYRRQRNKYNKAVKNCKNKQKASKLYDGIMTHNNIWSIVKKFLPDPDYRPPSVKMEIRGKSGKELADHMAKFFYDRARLVSDEDAIKCEAHIPLPTVEPSTEIDIDDDVSYTVEELFKGKKKPSLAAGPDTISHRHIVDLMPSISDCLQASVDKPLNNFTDIRKSYTRLLEKEPVTSKSVLTEKSQRPISELNALPKYGSIKIFIDQLRNQLLKILKDNQYAFPGKGGPMAIVKTLDDASEMSAKGMKTCFLLWDFSNAFCTTIHRIIVAVARKFNLSERMLTLLKEFLEQSFSAIKFSDKNGYYISDTVQTGRGTPQGQIGSDLIFALVNDCIDPIQVLDEIILRSKYVDDFTDVLAASNISTLFKSYKANEMHLKNSATSVGLKLNEGKTKIIPLNIHPDDLPQEYQDRYTSQAELLGFKFSVIGAPAVTEKESNKSQNKFHMSLRHTRANGHHSKVSGDPAALELISRLASATRTMYTLRKFEKDPFINLKAATSLVWSCCYDIGCVRAYCSDSIWEDVCKSIRKVIKAAGLDHMTSSEIVYRISTGYSPDIMALKQIVQLGIKFLNEDSLTESFMVKSSDSDKARPFWHRFSTEFNALPYTLREFIVKTCDPQNKSAVEKIKRRLKSHYIGLYNPNGKLSKEKVLKLLNQYSYSKEKIEKRKRDYEDVRKSRIEALLAREKKEKDKLFVTPHKRRKKFSENFVTPKVLREVAKCYGPKKDDKSANVDFVIEGYTPKKRPRKQTGVGRSESLSKRLNRSESENVYPVENVRKAVPDLVYYDTLDIPTGIHEIVENIKEIEIEFSTEYHVQDDSMPFIFSVAKQLSVNDISEKEHHTMVHGTGDEKVNVCKGVVSPDKQLCFLDCIASCSPWQYKIGQRKEKRKKLKQLYRLNRVRPPEKSFPSGPHN